MSATLEYRSCEGCGRQFIAETRAAERRCGDCRPKRRASRSCSECRELFTPEAGGDQFMCSACRVVWADQTE